MKRGNKTLLILGILLILLGIGLFSFPRFTHRQYQAKVEKSRLSFLEERKKPQPLPYPAVPASPAPPPSPLDQLYERMQEENRLLWDSRQPQIGPNWDYDQPLIDVTEYGLHDGIVGYLTVPKLDIQLPVMLGASLSNMRTGAGQMTYSSYPIGGINTNCVLSAHRGYSKTDMFRHIDRLEIGDPVYLENFRETLVYQVREIQIVDLQDMDSVRIREGEDLLTLLTCHPLGRNYQRYLVFCRRAPELEAEIPSTETGNSVPY